MGMRFLLCGRPQPLWLDALRTPAIDQPVRARLQVAIDIVEIEHHILDLAEGRHDVVGGGVDPDPSVDHHLLELLLAQALERLSEVRRIGAAGAVGAVAAQTGFGVAPPAIVSVLVDFAVLHHIGFVGGLVCRDDGAAGPGEQADPGKHRAAPTPSHPHPPEKLIDCMETT
jgi:hypothetical protein